MSVAPTAGRRQLSDGPSRLIRRAIRLATVLALVGGAADLKAGDWPQILGPQRDGQAADDEQLAAWGEDAAGPRLLWKQPLGEGFAGVAVAGSRVVAFHRMGDQELITARDAASGRRLWESKFPASYAGGINSDRGPRCVPLIDGQRVYAYGAGGDLHCVRADNGERVWSRALAKDYRALDGYFGAGSTPILVAGVLLVNVGGRDDAGIVGLDPKTGKTLWKQGEDSASYSSPAACRLDGEPLVVFVTRLHCVAVRPATGAEEFRFRFGQTGPTVNAATPLIWDNSLFLSASYGIGAQLRKLDDPSEVVWSNDSSMSSQYTTCVRHEGMLYGSHGREDIGGASLRCVDAATGEVRWEAPEIGVAHVILAGDKLLVQEVSGRLSLVEADPQACRVLSRHELGDGVWRALPALSSGRLYVRRSDGGGELRCLQVGR